MSVQRFVLMAMAGCLVVASLASCAAVNVSDVEKSHHLMIGHRVWGDYLLQRVHVQKSYSWFRIVKDTRTFTGDNVSQITQVQIIDQAKDGSGGYVTLANGGPGNNFVTLSFKSQRSQTIDFIVEIYGKRQVP